MLGLDLSMETWTRMRIEPKSWHLSLEARICAWRLGSEPQDQNLRSRLEIEPPGCDMSLELEFKLRSG